MTFRSQGRLPAGRQAGTFNRWQRIMTTLHQVNRRTHADNLKICSPVGDGDITLFDEPGHGNQSPHPGRDWSPLLTEWHMIRIIVEHT
jgi:hypothetical protein